MESELKVGHEIQMSMIPLEFPPFPDHDEFSIYAALEPAREVSDFSSRVTPKLTQSPWGRGGPLLLCPDAGGRIFIGFISFQQDSRKIPPSNALVLPRI